MHKKIITMFMAVYFSLFFLPSNAHELHQGDIQPWKVGAEIFVNSNVFESDFGDPSGGLFVTDEPGFDVNIAQGTFTPGNWLRFKAVGQLMFWNGAEWTPAVPNAERIEVVDALGNVILFRTDGVSEIPAVIGEIDSTGGLHEHLDFSILDSTNTLGGSAGAYRMELRLFESKANSDVSVAIATSPLTIVFNRGLEHEAFELAVAAADLSENSVFVDSTGVLSIQRVKAFGSAYKVKFQYLGNYQFQLIEENEIPKTAQ